MNEILGFLLLCFTSLFSIVNPLSTAVVYEALTLKYGRKEKQWIVKKATITMFFVLIMFAFTGLLILKFFNITIDALRIGGGIYLILISIRMLNPLRLQKEIHPTSQKEIKKGDDIAIVPLAIPLLSGPGAITTTIVLVTNQTASWGIFVVLSAIFIVAVLTYIILKYADIIKSVLGHTGIKTLEKIMGLIILCIGIQFILNGLKDYILALPL